MAKIEKGTEEELSSLSSGEEFIDVFDGDILSAGLFATLVELHLELEAVFASVKAREGRRNHSSVGQKDAVEGQTCSLDGVLVHFDFLIYF